jgi:hypothetical protein
MQILGLFGMYFDAFIQVGSAHTVYGIGPLDNLSRSF